MIGLLTGSAEAATVVEIRGQVAVGSQAMIQLKDVARIVDADAEVAARLGEIALLPAPATGRSLRITYEDIRSRLQAHGVRLTDVEFRGQLATEVRSALPHEIAANAGSRQSQTLPTPVRSGTPSGRDQVQANERLLAAFRRAFRTDGLEAGRVRIQCHVDPADVLSVLAATESEIHFLESQLRIGAEQSITASWQDSAGAQQQARVKVTIEELPLILAVRHSVPMGIVLRPEDLTWVPADDSVNGSARVADIIGKETTRNLKAGQVVTSADLISVPLVRSNDLVTVYVRRPGIVVRRPFKALTSGALHESVNLVAVDDPRLRVQATVTGYHEATLSPAPTEPQTVVQDRTGAIQFLDPGSRAAGVRP